MKKSIILSALLASSILVVPLFASSNANAQSSWPLHSGKTASNQGLSIDPVRGVLTLAPLLERTTPAVVNISVSSKVKIPKNPFAGRQLDDEFFERFFGERGNPFKNEQDGNDREDGERTMRSAGSGVIINAGKGYILTNNHVIAKADKITVTLTDRRQVDAEVVGTDPKTDIALLKIDLRGLTDVNLANSDQVKVGDYVIAIGNSFGIGQTVTTGIVSALGRSSFSRGDLYQNYIQTDAAINQGNSGGALINSKGELIGINSAILSRSGGSNGIGFAVPANMITNIMDQLVSYGEVRRGRIGVGIQDITPTLQEAMGLASRDGALVRQVEDDSPADKAGLKVGDVIVGFNGQEILDSDDIRNAVGAVERDSRAKISYIRDGKTYATKIRVEAAPDDEDTDTPAAEDNDNDAAPSSVDAFDGATLGNIPKDSDAHGGPDGVTEGVLVTKVRRGSDAWEAGLRKNDIIRAVNNKDIKNLADFKKQITNKDGAMFLSVQRGRTRVFVAVR
ncbi:MAG: DegQ family serine endoprotease [Robiginitomaculum sp.]|nr:DegQ family serine endoprotease [Robiginitomaculum sp.]